MKRLRCFEAKRAVMSLMPPGEVPTSTVMVLPL